MLVHHYPAIIFSQCLSKRNSTNPAIWLVPGIIKNASSLSGNLLNDLPYYINKNLLVKPLSSTSNFLRFHDYLLARNPRYPRPHVQFFPIRPSRLVNNVYLHHTDLCIKETSACQFQTITVACISTSTDSATLISHLQTNWWLSILLIFYLFLLVLPSLSSWSCQRYIIVKLP